jgi:hypothetical protein
MHVHPVVLADAERLELFSSLALSRRLFRGARIWRNPEGIAWRVARAGSIGVALTWLGPGWVFDPVARWERSEDYQRRLREMRDADRVRERREFRKVVRALRLGGHAERLLWAIHSAVHQTRRSLLYLPDCWLAKVVWGTQMSARPRQWRQVLSEVLHGLAWLHAAAWSDNGTMPEFGAPTALLTHVGDLRGTEEDVCAEDCPARGVRHHHFQVDVGPGFLGILEPFGRADDAGVRAYHFPTGGPKSDGPALWRVGQTGKLVSVFLPAKLGEPSACAAFTPRQHRLLQAVVRETTRARRRHRKDVAEPEVIAGNLVPDFVGKRLVACPRLCEAACYVGFNGNKLRKGLGYRLDTPCGWPSKAGYNVTEIGLFLKDLQALSEPLGIVAVGMTGPARQISLDQLIAMAASPLERHRLAEFHLRLYTAADYLSRWTAVFGGEAADPAPASAPVVEATAMLLAEMISKGVSRRALARGIGTDHSFLAKVLCGKKPWPKGLLETAQHWLASQDVPQPGGTPPPAASKVQGHGTMLETALALLDRGWSIVPQLPGAKKPCVRWKPYQTELPTPAQVRRWFGQWREAGLALVLGPVSNVLVIDVDGHEAHEALMERLGDEPLAPKALSGSRQPQRYHLFFAHPNISTRAKTTPWHDKLEFRGQGGIVIIPPSLHKSGNRYAWAPGRSPDDLSLSSLPPAVRNALTPTTKARRPTGTPARRVRPVEGVDASNRTLAFLSGKYADGPRWNDRLFNAACDLCGRDMPLEEAEPLLLAGAQPWTRGDEELARNTIRSAYSRAREPARL